MNTLPITNLQVIYTEYFIGSADWKTDLDGGGESSIVSQHGQY